MVRRANPSDLEDLSALFNGYREFYGQETDISGAYEFLSERMELNDSVIYAYEEDGMLTAFVQLYPLYSSIQMRNIWLLNDLFVSPTYRGKGISHELIHAAKDHARQTGACGLMLETHKSNSIGNTLYPAEGFSMIDNAHFYWWSA